MKKRARYFKYDEELACAIICLTALVLCFVTLAIAGSRDKIPYTPERPVETTGAHETVETDIPSETEKLVEIRDVNETEKLVEIRDVNETDAVDTEGLVEIEEVERLYTDEDAIALARMLWGEARGVKDMTVRGRSVSREAQLAACVWTVLNRYDAGFEDTIKEVVAAADQYLGYNPDHLIDVELLVVCYDVLDRWNAEKLGAKDVGRVLPDDYLWFKGDGKHNHFRNEFTGMKTWDWGLGDPYGG